MPRSSFKRRRIAPNEWSNWKRILRRRRSSMINYVTKVRISCPLSAQLTVTDSGSGPRDPVVTLNEHLMEALRRLRRNAADTSVDRRLITNILLQFITTPRADAKRFEMLGLLASILQWSDQERERAGLQRSVTAGGGAGKGRVAEEKIEESEVGRHLFSTLMSETDRTDSPSPKCGSNFSSKRPHRAAPDFRLLHILRMALRLRMLCRPYLLPHPLQAPVVRLRKVGLSFPRWP